MVAARALTRRSSSSAARDPVVAYHELLEDPGLAESSASLLGEGQRQRRLVFGDRPLCVSLRPNLISDWQYAAVNEASQTIYAALGRLERALLADEDLRRQLDLDPQEEALAVRDPGFRAASPSARLDGFIGEDGVIRFVEYNAESPAGMAYNDELAQVFASLPVMKAFRKKFSCTVVPTRGRQLTAMLRAHRSRSERAPAIAIVDWRGLPTLTEFEMFQRYFESRGVPTVICAPDDLTYSRGTLRARGKPINLVYRRVLTSELLAKDNVSRPLVRAYLEGAVTVVNSFRAKLLHKKMSLALLSDDRYAAIYTPPQRTAIAKHIPWTRKIREGHTTYGGKVVDLGDFVIAHRDRLVLKPNDEYGGKGVVLGWTIDQHEWEQSFLAALSSSYVVQERVDVPRYPFPVLLGKMHFLDLSIDHNPYLFWGAVSGCLARVSSSALLNVTAGAGSVVPTYVIAGGPTGERRRSATRNGK
ncbi:MAG TPA: circularly permuted type 2 ATP-grasp protein [Candidatus Polarisedimenticolia bacterium]|nr:circularly permuted type 2 ATP-grasp protein [Candidatus Polarisedimenticolia bacterium]